MRTLHIRDIASLANSGGGKVSPHRKLIHRRNSKLHAADSYIETSPKYGQRQQ